MSAPFFYVYRDKLDPIEVELCHYAFVHRFIMKGQKQLIFFKAAADWCEDRFGEGAPWSMGDPKHRWVWNALGDIHMVDEHAALEFRLRWT